MVVRGDLWWVDFGETLGSEPGYRRPVLIISSDRFNNSRISTVLVCALTSNLRLAQAPGNVEITAGTGGLPRDCVVNVTQLGVIDRVRLIQRIGSLPLEQQYRVDQGLRLVLDLHQ